MSRNVFYDNFPERNRLNEAYVHVMSSTGGVEIVDISNRMQPVLKGLDTESSVRVTRRFGDDFAVQRALGGGIEAVPVEATDEEE